MTIKAEQKALALRSGGVQCVFGVCVCVCVSDGEGEGPVGLAGEADDGLATEGLQPALGGPDKKGETWTQHPGYLPATHWAATLV